MPSRKSAIIVLKGCYSIENYKNTLLNKDITQCVFVLFLHVLLSMLDKYHEQRLFRYCSSIVVANKMHIYIRAQQSVICKLASIMMSSPAVHRINKPC